MNKIRTSILLFSLLAIGSASTFLSSCKEKDMQGLIIFTRSSGINNNQVSTSSELGAYISGTQILSVEPGATAKVLTTEFYSARSPQVSTDGRYMIFTGQKKETDPWQIWEMDLESHKSTQLTASKESCTDPAYLPLGRFVFSKLNSGDSLKAEHSLFTCNLDGTDLKRITFNPHTYFSSNVLNDGRILTVGSRVFPDKGVRKFMIMRPDGTKAELFYQGQNGTRIIGPGLETNDRKIVFIEAGMNEKRNLISINYNRPLHSYVNMSKDLKGDFMSVFPESSGKLLVSYRNSASEKYGLYEFDTEKNVLGKQLFSSNDFDILEAVVVEKQERPRKLPSEVNFALKTGLLMSQDINFTADQPVSAASSLKRATRVEIMGADSSLGIFTPSNDGSFYLKIIADKPFQIRTLDENGKVMQQCDWLWLRPNERRGCVGCHENQEMAPANRIPHAVKKAPIGIPLHVSKIKDTKIDTE